MSSSSLPRRQTTSPKTMPLLVALVALVGGLLTVLVAPPAAAFVDRDCSDFPSQRAAQLFFLRHGGPQRDPHRLDDDNDDVACESNPPPTYTRPTLPNPPKPKPEPKPVVVRTTATLAVSAVKRIAGERLTLTGKVKPAMRRKVVLQRRTRGSSWVRLSAGRTNRKGTIWFTGRASQYDATYRLVVPAARKGRKRFTADSSAARRVDTLPQVVRLRVPRTATVGENVVARVTAKPVRAGRRVVLQVRDADSWRRLVIGVLNRNGVERFRFMNDIEGDLELRAVVRRYRGAVPGSSTTRVVTFSEEEPPPDTTPPETPTNVATTAGDGQVTVSWDAVSATDLHHYVLERAESGAEDWTNVELTNPTGTSQVVNGLTNGTAYVFRVRAVDESGNESDFSDPVEGTPMSG